MLKFAVSLIFIILLMVFTIQNIEQVEVQLPFIKDAFRIRLIYLLFSTYILGWFSSHLWTTARQWKSSKKKIEPQEDESLDDCL